MRHQNSEIKSFITYKKDELFAQLLNSISGRFDPGPKIPHHTPEEQAILKEIAHRLMNEIERDGLARLDKEGEIKLLRKIAAQVIKEKKETSTQEKSEKSPEVLERK